MNADKALEFFSKFDAIRYNEEKTGLSLNLIP